MPLILPARTLDSGYEIDNSLRFNKGDSSFLNRQFSGANTSRKTFTLSFWVKRTNLGSPIESPISAETNSNEYDQVIFTSTDELDVNNVAGGSDVISFKTSMKFRDPSAWYHIVIAIDTTQASSSNGVKIYVNGVLQTSFASTTYAQNATFEIGRDGSTTSIGRRERDGDGHGVGYLSDFYYIDGQQKAASDFGETNDNGVWIPKKYDGTYGNNGFLLEFKQSGTSQNSSGMGADTSGNDEHFAVTNLTATDVTVDTPTNNFCTLNPLANAGGATLSEGNTKCVGAAASDKNTFSTFGLTKGKWYFEIKVTDQAARGTIFISDTEHNSYTGTNYAGHQTWDGVSYTSATANSNVGSGASDNDIICVAADLDNGQVWYAKNGNIDTSGTANITGLPTTTTYRISQSESGSPASTMEHNYGNPPFSISSGNSDANGYGNFEYAVPSGYYSLCTKNLAEYG
jgi:hypothetical protein